MVSRDALHKGLDDAKSKSPPLVAPLPNLIPLPSWIFFWTLSSIFTGLSLTSDLLYKPQEFNKKVVKIIRVINFNRFEFMKIIDTRKWWLSQNYLKIWLKRVTKIQHILKKNAIFIKISEFFGFSVKKPLFIWIIQIKE